MIIDIPIFDDFSNTRTRFDQTVEWWRARDVEVVINEADDDPPFHPVVGVSRYPILIVVPSTVVEGEVHLRPVYRFRIHGNYEDIAILFKLTFG